jgi:hypothetical protein
MEKTILGTDAAEHLAQPVALPREWLEHVAGGLNPQPLPPGEDHE